MHLTEKEFLIEYKAALRGEVLVNDKVLLGGLWSEWDGESTEIEIGKFESKTGNPVLIDIPQIWIDENRGIEE